LVRPIGIRFREASTKVHHPPSPFASQPPQLGPSLPTPRNPSPPHPSGSLERPNASPSLSLYMSPRAARSRLRVLVRADVHAAALLRVFMSGDCAARCRRTPLPWPCPARPGAVAAPTAPRAAPRACRCPCRAAATATCAACSARSATAAPMSPGSPPVTPPVLAQLSAGGCRLRLRLPPRCAPRDTAASRFLTAQAARRARPCPPAAADAAARLRRFCGRCSTAPSRHRRGAHVRARRTGGLLVPRLRLCPTRAPAGTGTSPLGGRAVCVEYGVALPRPPRVCGPARRRGGGYRRCHRSCRRLCCPLSTDCWSCCSSPSPPACK
jgi:hypothetical protein